MSCSAEEIAEKRRQALERLKISKSTNQPIANSPQRQSNPSTASTKVATSPGTDTKSTSAFYGGTTDDKTSELNAYQNKMKSLSTHKNNNRILSQPYSSRERNPIANSGKSDSTAASTYNNNNNAKTDVKKVMPTFKSSSAVTCSCSAISDDRFQVVPSAFHAKLIDVFKSIPTRKYDSNTRIWSFNLVDYELVQERVNHLNPDVVIGALPKFVLKLLRSEKTEVEYSWLDAIECKLSSSLLDFQKYGVGFGIKNQGRCLIADDMGLGKTYQAIAIADFYKDDWPLLICTTATARETWEKHLRDLLPWIPGQLISCLTSTQDYFGDCKVLITSYSLMDRNCDRLLEKNFRFLIFDESHTIKNFKTKSAQSAHLLGAKAKRIVLLTGTPALSRPAELFCQLNLIDNKFFGSFKEYSMRYCAGKQTSFGFDSSGQSNLNELNVVLRRKFMVRRTKEDVEFELGEKSRETIILDPQKIWEAKDDCILEAVENLKEYSKDVMRLKGPQRDEVLLRLYSETAKLKARAVCSYIKGLVRENLKFIVFGYHQVMLNALTDCLSKLNVDFIRIDGSTRNDLRNTYINRFQKKTSCRVALLSLKACNAAITLTSANLVVFSELDWNPSTLAQCESRAHRIGQKSPVTCRYLLAQGTADDYIWAMLKKKQDVLNKAGLFCEDLSDATHSAAPISEINKLTQYFETTPKTSLTSASNNSIEIQPISTSDQNTELIDNKNSSYKHMLDNDDEDAAFLEIDF